MPSVNFALMVRICGDVGIEQLRNALERVREKYPPLIARDNAKQHYFPLRCPENCDDTAWVAAAQSELQEPIPDDAGTFARFVLIKQKDYSDLIGVFHHGVCDGMSGVCFLRDVVRLLGDPGFKLSTVPSPQHPFGLVPAAVAENPRVKFQVWVAFMSIRLALLFRRFRKKQSGDVENKQNHSLENIPLSRQYNVLPASLTPAQTAALVARCHVENTSVHAAVCTAWLRAFAVMDEERKSWTRSISSPVNLRNRFAEPVGDAAGFFLGMVETSVDCAPQRDFWQIAREFKQKLKRDSVDEKIFVRPLLFSAIFSKLPKAELAAAAENLFDRPVSYDFSITNLGRLDFPVKFGPSHVEAFYGPLVNSSEYERTVGVNTFSDRMTFSYVFRKSKMELLQAKILMQGVIDQLQAAVGW